MKKIKYGIILILIFVIGRGCYKSNEGKNIQLFFNDFLNNEEYISYYAGVHVSSSGKYEYYSTEDKKFVCDLVNYLMSFNTKKYNDLPKNKIHKLEETDNHFWITLLARNKEEISSIIIINIDSYNLFDIENNYNKKYDDKYYYLNENIDGNVIIDLIEKYNMEKLVIP